MGDSGRDRPDVAVHSFCESWLAWASSKVKQTLRNNVQLDLSMNFILLSKWSVFLLTVDTT